MNYTTQTIKTKHGIITIHQPILSDSERRTREQDVVSALEHFGKAITKEKQQ